MIDKIPYSILVPIFLEEDESLLQTMNIPDILENFIKIFGYKKSYDMMNDLIGFLIHKENGNCLEWILSNEERFNRYFQLYARCVEEKIRVSHRSWPFALNFLETLCSFGKIDLFKEYALMPLFSNLLTKNYIDLGTRFCAKHGKVKETLDFIENDVSNRDMRLHIAFSVSLFEGKYIVYSTLYKKFSNDLLDLINDYHYKCAQIGSYGTEDINYEENPLRFLLKIDHRIWHYNPYIKVVYFKKDDVIIKRERFTLKEPLFIEECASKNLIQH